MRQFRQLADDHKGRSFQLNYCPLIVCLVILSMIFSHTENVNSDKLELFYFFYLQITIFPFKKIRLKFGKFR